MNEKKGFARLAVLVVGILAVALISLGGCKKTDEGIDLAPFIEMALNAPCTDISNRLFLIDGDKVLWSRTGNCWDFAYETVLYGETIYVILAKIHDSIGGPQETIYDESYRDMFNTIIANLEKNDLGLGPGHTVQEVHF
jgi:hypothetical protein